jgi:pyridoxine 4-dehydrogenase
LAIMGNEQWTFGGDTAVNRVGYGTMKLTGWPRGERPDRDTALAILRRAVELGVNHLDTSNYYARDGVAANELIRSALHPYPAATIRSSMPVPQPGSPMCRSFPSAGSSR